MGQNGHGQIGTRTDPNGLVEEWDYDRFGRLTKATAPDGTGTRISLLPCDAECQAIDNGAYKRHVEQVWAEVPTGNFNVKNNQYSVHDGLGRALMQRREQIGSVYSYTQTKYTDRGQVEQQSQPYLAGAPPIWTTLTYDEIGRVTDIVRVVTNEIDGTPATTSLDYDGLSVTQTDPLSHITTRVDTGMPPFFGHLAC